MRASINLRVSQRLHPRALPPLNNIQHSVGNILKRWPDAVNLPKDRDREHMALEMLRRINEWDWDGVKTSRITTAAVAVFDDQRCDRPDLENVRRFYFEEISIREPGSFLNAMVWVYIDSFREGAAHTLALAKILSHRIADFGSRIQDLLQALPGLFKVKNAPFDVAKIMLKEVDPFYALKEIGFRAPHGPGLAQYAHAIFVEKIQPKLRQPIEQARLFKWLMPKNGSVLETGAGSAIEALLSVWRDKTPSDDVRHDISETIIKAYNDPRLNRGGIWSGFDPELRDTLLRWLTKQDMEFFCDMVTSTQDSHMWPPRRNFWLKLYEDKLIDEAWVAFGATARQYALRHLVKAGSANMNRRFGRQLDRRERTSLLVMRIGNKIVVDGCHSYKTQIFRQDDPKAPKLYQQIYYCDDILRTSSNSKSHSSIPSWQSWVMKNV